MVPSNDEVFILVQGATIAKTFIFPWSTLHKSSSIQLIFSCLLPFCSPASRILDPMELKDLLQKLIRCHFEEELLGVDTFTSRICTFLGLSHQREPVIESDFSLFPRNNHFLRHELGEVLRQYFFISVVFESLSGVIRRGIKQPSANLPNKSAKRERKSSPFQKGLGFLFL